MPMPAFPPTVPLVGQVVTPLSGNMPARCPSCQRVFVIQQLNYDIRQGRCDFSIVLMPGVLREERIQ